MMNSEADDRGPVMEPMCHHLLVLYFTDITTYKIDRFLMPRVVEYLSVCQDVAGNINIAGPTEMLRHQRITMLIFAGMEPEADSDREEEPAHLLTAWLGELDTLKKVNNCPGCQIGQQGFYITPYYCCRASTLSRPRITPATALL